MWYAEEALCESGCVSPLPQDIKDDLGPSSLLESKSAAALASQRTAADRWFTIKVSTLTACNSTQGDPVNQIPVPLHLHGKSGHQTHLQTVSQDTVATGKLKKQSPLNHKVLLKKSQPK